MTAIFVVAAVLAPRDATAESPVILRCTIGEEAGFSIAKLEIENPTPVAQTYNVVLIVRAGEETWRSPARSATLEPNDRAEHLFRPFGAGTTIEECSVGVVGPDGKLVGPDGKLVGPTGEVVAPDSPDQQPAAPAPVPASVTGLPAPQPSPAAHVPEGPLARGGVLELQLGAGQALIDSNTVLSTSKAGLFVGYRGGPATIGIGIDLVRVSDSSDSGGFSSEQSATRFMIMPGIRLTLLNTTDRKVELFGQLDLGIGKVFQSSDAGSVDAPNHQLAYQLGPGVRYWVHPQMGIGAATGLRGEFFHAESSDGTISSDLSLTSVFTSLQITGLF